AATDSFTTWSAISSGHFSWWAKAASPSQTSDAFSNCVTAPPPQPPPPPADFFWLAWSTKIHYWHGEKRRVNHKGHEEAKKHKGRLKVINKHLIGSSLLSGFIRLNPPKFLLFSGCLRGRFYSRITRSPIFYQCCPFYQVNFSFAFLRVLCG